MDDNYYYEIFYDDQNRISEVKVNSQSLMSYTYEMDDTYYTDRLSTQTYSNGDAIKFIYTDEDQIEEIHFMDNGGTFVKRFSYEYDQSGNIAVFNTYVNGELDSSEYYTYDSSNRLTKVIDNLGNEIKYMYDESGNVTSLYFNLDEVEGNTNYFYNHCFVFNQTTQECTSKSNLYDYTEYTTQNNVDVKKEYHHEDSALYRLDYINLITGTSNLVKQNFTYVGSTTRLYEIEYDISNDGNVEFKYRYYYDSLGNIEEVYYYEGTSLKTYEHYQYDEMNQLIIEDVEDVDADCSILQDTCYTKYYYYDMRGNITDVKTFLYDQDDYTTLSIPPFYESSKGMYNAKMYYNGSNEYNGIYNLSIGETPSLSFTYFDTDNLVPIIGMTTTQTYSNLNTSVEGYYYRKYTATDQCHQLKDY